MGFFVALAYALPSYIQSSFLEDCVSVSTVSVFFLLANFFGVFAILFYPNFIRKINNFNSAMIVLSLLFISLLSLSFVSDIKTIFLFFILGAIAINLAWINMDLFVESFTKNVSTGKTRTIYFTFLNLGRLLSPVITAYLIGLSGYRLVFFISSLTLLPFFALLFKNKKILVKKVIYEKLNISKSISFLSKDKDLRGIYFLAILLQLFYSSAVIFIPIYLHQILGFSWSTLSIIFSVMLLPFILFEIPAGIIADKYLGEKEIMFSGLLIMTISLFLFFYISSTSALIWGVVLFFSRIGAALVEAMRESYFFKKIDVENLNMINLFRTATPLGYLLGSGLGAVLSIFLEIQYIFLAVSFVFLLGFYFVLSIKDTK